MLYWMKVAILIYSGGKRMIGGKSVHKKSKDLLLDLIIGCHGNCTFNDLEGIYISSFCAFSGTHPPRPISLVTRSKGSLNRQIYHRGESFRIYTMAGTRNIKQKQFSHAHKIHYIQVQDSLRFINRNSLPLKSAIK